MWGAFKMKEINITQLATVFNTNTTGITVEILTKTGDIKKKDYYEMEIEGKYENIDDELIK